MITNDQLENIPKDLKEKSQWVLWKKELPEGRNKPTKVPYQRNGSKAASTKSSTWTNFSAAVSALKNNSKKYDGIGFCLSEGTPIGIDLDHCRCPAFSGIEIIAPWAKDIINKIDSYTEASPSGRGIHIFAYGDKLPAEGRKKGDFEIYKSGRYLTITGNHILGTPKDILNRTDVINTVFHDVFGTDTDRGVLKRVQPTANINVRDVLEKAFISKNGAKIQSLYNGNHSDYPSQSEADLALCAHLAFWLSSDAGAIDQTFRTSGLFRPKWDEKHFANGQTYGQSVIKKAIQSTKETYTEYGFSEITQKPTWEEPVLFSSIDTPDIPTELLPGFLGDYCKAVSEATQTPGALSVAMGLATVSTCIQKRFEVSAYDGYIEPVNLWTCSALEPGTRKTAVKQSFTSPLTQWEKEKADEMKRDIQKVKHQRDVNQRRIDQLKIKAAKPETEQAERENCLRQISEIEDSTPVDLNEPRLWTDDVTPERLQDMLCDHNERMSLISDEGGTFEVMAGLYNNGRSNVNVYLQAHAGAEVRVDRQGRGVMLNRPALTFGLTVQPQVITDLAQGNKARFRGNGMLARFLYFIPKSTVGHRDVTRNVPVPETIRTAYHNGIFHLLNISTVFDEHGRARARMLTLHPQALSAWQQFSGYIESKQGENGEFYSFQDWTSKLPGAALRIAGLLHVVEHGEQTAVITYETMARALDLSELLISHARAAFDLMGSEQAVSDAKSVFKWVSGLQGRFNQREALKRHEGRFKRLERLKKALEVLTERHIISQPITNSSGGRGRPEIYYLINPSIIGGNNYGMA